jgi:hypothetical protein
LPGINLTRYIKTRKNIILSTHEQNLQPIDWSRPVGIHCIDDRGYADSHQNLKLGGASSYGLAFDTYAARALVRDGRLEAEIPTGELAKVITKGLARYELLANLHHGCAAELGVPAIGHEIVSNGEPIFNEVNRILDGSVSESEFEQLQRFYAGLDHDTSLFRGVAVEAAHMESDGTHPAIGRSYLAHDDHSADTLRINTTTDTWHDAAGAYADGAPLYQYDLWAVPPIAERIDAIIPHDNVDGFALASVVRVVATSRLLPREHRKGVDIVRH